MITILFSGINIKATLIASSCFIINKEIIPENKDTENNLLATQIFLCRNISNSEIASFKVNGGMD